MLQSALGDYRGANMASGLRKRLVEEDLCGSNSCPLARLPDLPHHPMEPVAERCRQWPSKTRGPG